VSAEVIAAFSDSNYNSINFNRYSIPIISEKPIEVSALLARFLAFSLNHSSVTAVSNMSYVAKGDKEYDAAGPVPAAKLHKIRITLTSSNVRNLEKCTFFLHCLPNVV